MKKRLLALLLCLVMVIGLVPTVLAGGETIQETYEIWLDLHDGTTNYPHFTVTKGANKSPEDVAQYASRAGYTLNRWYAGENTYTFENGIYNDQTDVDGCFWVHADWKENTYKVVFNPNGGEGTMADQTFTGSVGYTVLAKNAFTKTDYTFAGWGLSATSNAVTYSDNNCAVTTTVQSFFTKQADGTYLLTLYAIWEPIEQPAQLRKITYIDAGKGTMDDYVDNGDFIYIDPNGGTAKLGNTDINKAGLHKIESDVTLTAPKGSLGWKLDISAERHTFTAVWPSSKYTVSFYCYNHGNDYINNVPYGTKLIIDPNYGTYNGSTARTEITVTSDVTVKDASRYG